MGRECKACCDKTGTECVPHGWHGPGLGDNYCNSTWCTDGVMASTLMMCLGGGDDPYTGYRVDFTAAEEANKIVPGLFSRTFYGVIDPEKAKNLTDAEIEELGKIQGVYTEQL